MQKCYSSNIEEEFECVTFTDGVICVEIKVEQRLLKIAMANDNLVDIRLTEPSRTEPIAETDFSRPGGEEDSEKLPVFKTQTLARLSRCYRGIVR